MGECVGRRKTCVWVVLAGWALCASADRLTFSSGRSLQVIIEGETDGSVTFRKGTGLITMPKTNIREIVHDSPAENQQLKDQWRREHFLNSRYSPAELKELLDEYRSLLKDRGRLMAEHRALLDLEARQASLSVRVAPTQTALLTQKETLRKKELAEIQLRRQRNELIREMNQLVAQMNTVSELGLWRALEAQHAQLGVQEEALSAVLDRAAEERLGVTKQLDESVQVLQEAQSVHERLREDTPRFYAQLGPYMGRIGQLEKLLVAYDSPPVRARYGYIFEEITDALKEMRSELRTDAVTLARDGNVLLVDVVINGTVPARMIFDTGAGLTTISKELAGRLGLDTEKPSDSFAVLADGSRVPTVSFTVGSIRLGKAVRDQVEVHMLEQAPSPGIDGLLGMTFLKHFSVKFSGDQGSVELTHLEAGGR